MNPAEPLTESCLRDGKEIDAGHKPKAKESLFDTVLASALGGGSLGGLFGSIPGTFVGMLVGALLGFYFGKQSNAC